MKSCRRCGIEKAFTEFRADPRYADGVGSWCILCHRQRNSEWAKENRERLTKKSAQWRSKNPEKARKIDMSWKLANKDKTSARYRKWRKANLEYDRARAAVRKANKLTATPPWANLEKIAEFYRNTPDGLQVDHIVPFTSPIVCGLHCEDNLQYLTPSENQSKRNFWWPDMPDERIENAQRQQRMAL